MRIRLVNDQQFAELVRNGQVQEILTDGVPAYQVSSISNEAMAQFPRRIDYVVEALVVASEYLRDADRFSLYAFASQAHCMIPSTFGRERSRLYQAARELEYMRLGDDTRMAEGLAMAVSELQGAELQQVERQPGAALPAATQEYAARLILLTDGHTRNVDECYQWARKARQAGIKLTTMGIGVEFNEELLIPLADLTSGNAYYIETPEQIPEAFRRELGAALRISYRNVEIKLRLAKGVELRHAYRALPELGYFDPGPNMDGSFALLVGDYDPAAPVALLLELIVPAMPPGDYRLAQAMLAWDGPGAEAREGARSGAEEELSRQSVRQDIVAKLSSKVTAPLNERVMNIVEKVGVFKMGSTALEAAQNATRSANPADKGAATLRLRQAATRLLDMGEKYLADAMLEQAEALERSGNLDPDATKKLRYETRRLTQRV
ncbi:MAG: VWA domain-containing protein [Anaerolineales bacterium]|nr:VWA domain-containing protein [Anaerolineales bacterium]